MSVFNRMYRCEQLCSLSNQPGRRLIEEHLQRSMRTSTEIIPDVKRFSNAKAVWNISPVTDLVKENYCVTCEPIRNTDKFFDNGEIEQEMAENVRAKHWYLPMSLHGVVGISDLISWLRFLVGNFIFPYKDIFFKQEKPSSFQTLISSPFIIQILLTSSLTTRQTRRSSAARLVAKKFEWKRKKRFSVKHYNLRPKIKT